VGASEVYSSALAWEGVSHNYSTMMFAKTTNFAFALHLLNGTYGQQILHWRLWLGLTQVHPKTPQLPEWLSLKQKLETCCGQVIVWYWKCDWDNPTWVKETLLHLQLYIYICVCVCVCVGVCVCVCVCILLNKTLFVHVHTKQCILALNTLTKVSL